MSDIRRRWMGRALMVLGAALFCAWLIPTLEGRAYQASLGRRLDVLRQAHGGSRTEADPALAKDLIGRIEIPRVGLSAIVVEGTNGRSLRHGVGHLAKTAHPGESGNVVLAGHRDTFFRPLKDVVAGDLIRISTPVGEYAYRVDSVLVVDPDRGDVLDDTGQPALTLVTCYPFYWVGPAPRRFVVCARPVDASSQLAAAWPPRFPRRP